MRWRSGRLLAAVLALIWPLATASSQAPAPGSELDVYLVTMGPGDAIWERFGHNGVGIRDRSTGTDVIYNWGVFDFTEAGFLPRFIRGEMLYRVEPHDALLTFAAYRRANRSVGIQELNLTPAQRHELRAFVEWNALDANKNYRYDYFLDNCSTRARDALDKALGGLIQRQFAGVASGRTFRDEARRLADADLLYTGIDIGLGTPSDREMTRHEAMFVPMTLRDLLREVRVVDAAGVSTPLVVAEREVFVATRAAELVAPADHQGRSLLIGLAVAALMLGVARVRSTAGRGLAALWCGLAGVLGALLLGLWGLTSHRWAYQNVNLLLFNPLWFLVMIWVARARPVAARARPVLLGVAMLAVVGVVMGLVRVPQRAEQVALLVAAPHAAVFALLLRRRA